MRRRGRTRGCTSRRSAAHNHALPAQPLACLSLHFAYRAAPRRNPARDHAAQGCPGRRGWGWPRQAGGSCADAIGMPALAPHVWAGHP